MNGPTNHRRPLWPARSRPFARAGQASPRRPAGHGCGSGWRRGGRPRELQFFVLQRFLPGEPAVECVVQAARCPPPSQPGLPRTHSPLPFRLRRRPVAALLHPRRLSCHLPADCCLRSNARGLPGPDAGRFGGCPGALPEIPSLRARRRQNGYRICRIQRTRQATQQRPTRLFPLFR